MATVKERATELINKMVELYNEGAQKVIKVFNNKMLSADGQQAEIRKIQQNIINNLNTAETAFMNEVNSVLSEADRKDSERTEFCRTNADYLATLSRTLEVLPYAIHDCDYNELKERMNYFADDPFALAALGSKIKTLADPKEDHTRFMDLLPDDMRGKHQETLKKLVNTMSYYKQTLIDSMENSGSPYAESFIAQTDSTLKYIEECNDDCTEYTPNDDYVEYEEVDNDETEKEVDEEAADFGFGFQKVRK